jgi:uncharacterized protein YaiI (UPF0178 family)
MTEEEALNVVEKSINKAYDKGKRFSKDIIAERFSGENLQKLQKNFISLYGSDEIAQEHVNSFAAGFGKACEVIIKDLNTL